LRVQSLKFVQRPTVNGQQSSPNAFKIIVKKIKMKFIVSLIVTAILSFAACLFLPWWSIAIAAFIVAAAIPQKPAKAFAAASLALFLLWGGLSFIISNSNGHILAHKISTLIISMDNPILLVVVTAIIGSLVAGFAALAGSFLRQQKV
jgi:hypothetical protein